MTAKYLSTKPTYWEQQAHQCLARGDYAQAANFMKRRLKRNRIKILLLAFRAICYCRGKKQKLRRLACRHGRREPEQVELWTAELIQVLQTEAERRGNLSDYSMLGQSAAYTGNQPYGLTTSCI
jgi:hypothetical protein